MNYLDCMIKLFFYYDMENLEFKRHLHKVLRLREIKTK